MARGDARVGKWRENWRMEWVASTLQTTSEHGVSSITAADAHNSAATSRLNWRPSRFKWTRPFRRKTNSGFCACAITFQTQSTMFRTLQNSFRSTENCLLLQSRCRVAMRSVGMAWGLNHAECRWAELWSCSIKHSTDRQMRAKHPTILSLSLSIQPASHPNLPDNVSLQRLYMQLAARGPRSPFKCT